MEFNTFVVWHKTECHDFNTIIYDFVSKMQNKMRFKMWRNKTIADILSESQSAKNDYIQNKQTDVERCGTIACEKKRMKMKSQPLENTW